MFNLIRKYKKKLQPMLLKLVSGIITIGFGALFISGTLTSTFLNFMPLILHKIIGFLIIAVYLISLLLAYKRR